MGARLSKIPFNAHINFENRGRITEKKTILVNSMVLF